MKRQECFAFSGLLTKGSGLRFWALCRTLQDLETWYYIDDLNKAINEDRAAHGKKPLKFNGDELKEETEEEKENHFDDDSQGVSTSGGKG